MTSQPNQEQLIKLTEAINLGEIMAKNTIDVDLKLKDVMFKLLDLYKEVVNLGSVTDSEIDNTLNAFYAIDPEYIQIIRDAIKAPETNDSRRTGEQLSNNSKVDSRKRRSKNRKRSTRIPSRTSQG